MPYQITTIYWDDRIKNNRDPTVPNLHWLRNAALIPAQFLFGGRNITYVERTDSFSLETVSSCLETPFNLKKWLKILCAVVALLPATLMGLSLSRLTPEVMQKRYPDFKTCHHVLEWKESLLTQKPLLLSEQRGIVITPDNRLFLALQLLRILRTNPNLQKIPEATQSLQDLLSSPFSEKDLRNSRNYHLPGPLNNFLRELFSVRHTPFATEIVKMLASDKQAGHDKLHILLLILFYEKKVRGRCK